MTAALALLASLLWGTSDFLGGTLTRRMSTWTVIGVSQLFSLASLVPAAALSHGWSAPRGYLPWGLAAAAMSLVALAAFYQALATGTMGVVAPIASLSVVLPVVVGLALGEAPSLLQLTGAALAAAGVVLAAGPQVRGARAGESSARPLLLAAVAAVGFGLIIVCIARGSRYDVVMTMLTLRVVEVGVIVAVAAALRRAPAGVTRADLPTLALVGFADLGANVCFGVASRSGLLAVVSVLSSLYPAVTVLLARRVHHESLRPVQGVGVVGMLAGVALIAAGGGTG